MLGDLVGVAGRYGPCWEPEEYIRSPKVQIIVLHEHRPVGGEHVFKAYPNSPPKPGSVSVSLYVVAACLRDAKRPRIDEAESPHLDVLVVVARPGGTAFCINECLRSHGYAHTTGRGSEPARLSKLVKLVGHGIEKPALQVRGPIEHALNT